MTLNNGIQNFSLPLIDNSNRARNILIIFWIYFLIGILMLISSFMDYQLYSNAVTEYYYDENEFVPGEIRQALVAFLQLSIMLFSIIFFLMWFYRAYSNLHKTSKTPLEYNKNMAIWAFFIPILNLYRPFKIAHEIAVEGRLLVNSLRGSIGDQFPGWIIGLWWGAYLINNIVDNIAGRMMNNAGTNEQFANTASVYIFSNIINLLAILMTIYMIRMISKDEQFLSENIEFDQLGMETKDDNEVVEEEMIIHH